MKRCTALTVITLRTEDVRLTVFTGETAESGLHRHSI